MSVIYKTTDPETGIEWCARLVFQGDTYGLNHCLEHDESDPLVEFYDMDSKAAEMMRESDNPAERYEGEEYGQFVSRYYLSTLKETDWTKSNGLNLDGGVDRWTLSGVYMADMMVILDLEISERAEMEKRFS